MDKKDVGKPHPQCRRCHGQGKVGDAPCPCTEETFASKIRRGELKSCPVCGSALQSMGVVQVTECSSETCCWTDELADFERMGWYTPPPDWKKPPETTFLKGVGRGE